MPYAVNSGGTITIKANVRIYFGICTSLERQLGYGWVELTATRPENCPDIGLALEAGATGPLLFAIPAGLPQGTYTVRVLSMSREDGNAITYTPLDRSETVTNQFTVN